QIVDDGVLVGFRDYLTAHTPVDKATDRHRACCRLWNEAGQRVTDWPGQAVSLPDYRPPRRRLALEDLPASFTSDLEAYLARRADPDLFDPDAPKRPLKPRTLRLRSEQIRLAAAALVARGRPAASLQRLADLVEITAFKEILRQLLADHQGK